MVSLVSRSLGRAESIVIVQESSDLRVSILKCVTNSKNRSNIKGTACSVRTHFTSCNFA